MDFIGQKNPCVACDYGGFCPLPIRVDPFQAVYKPGTLPGMESEPGIKTGYGSNPGEKAMLTDTQCRTAKPKEKPYKLSDGKGLYLEIKPNGVKAWRYRFELREGDVVKESIFAIGDYAISSSGETPEEGQARRAGRRFTLAEARDERIKARALVKQGINPAHNRQLERIKREQESATTFEAVAKEWLALKDCEEITRKGRLDCSPAWFFPKIGSLPVKSITPAHILDVLIRRQRRTA